MRADEGLLLEVLGKTYKRYEDLIKNNLVNAAEESVSTSLSYVEAVARTHPERLNMTKKEVNDDPHKAFSKYLGRDTIETAMKIYNSNLQGGKSKAKAAESAFFYTKEMFDKLIKYNSDDPKDQADFKAALTSLAGTYDNQGGVYILPTDSKKYTAGNAFIQNTLDKDVDLPGKFGSFMSTLFQPSLIGKWAGDAITNISYGAGLANMHVGASVRNAVEESFSQEELLRQGGYQGVVKAAYGKGAHNIATYAGMGLMIGEAIGVSALLKSPAALKYYMVTNSAISDLREETGLSQRYVFGNVNQDADYKTFIQSRVFDAVTISLSNMLSPAVSGAITSDMMTNVLSKKAGMALSAAAQVNLDVAFDAALDFAAHNIFASMGTEFTVGQQRQLGLWKNSIDGRSFADKVMRELIFRAANRYGSQFLKGTKMLGKNVSPYAKTEYWQKNWNMHKLPARITAFSHRLFGQEVGEIGRYLNEDMEIRNDLIASLKKNNPDIDVDNKDLFTQLVKTGTLDKHSMYMLYLAKEKATNAYFAGLFDKTTGRLTNYKNFKETVVMNDPLMQPVARGFYTLFGGIKLKGEGDIEAFEQRILETEPIGDQEGMSIRIRNKLFGGKSINEIGGFGIVDMQLSKNLSPNDIDNFVKGLAEIVKRGDSYNDRTEISKRLGLVLAQEFPRLYNNFLTKGSDGSAAGNADFVERMTDAFNKEFSGEEFGKNEAQSHAANFGFKSGLEGFETKTTTQDQFKASTEDIVEVIDSIRKNMGYDSKGLDMFYNHIGNDEIIKLSGSEALKMDKAQAELLKQAVETERDFLQQDIFRRSLYNSSKQTNAKYNFVLSHAMLKKANEINSKLNIQDRPGNTLTAFRAEYLRSLGGYVDNAGNKINGVADDIVEGLTKFRDNTKITDEQKLKLATQGIITLLEIKKASGYRLPEGVMQRIDVELNKWDSLAKSVTGNDLYKAINDQLPKETFDALKKLMNLDENESVFKVMINFTSDAAFSSKLAINRMSAITASTKYGTDFSNIADLLANKGQDEADIIRNILATSPQSLGSELPSDYNMFINGRELNPFQIHGLESELVSVNGVKPDESRLKLMMGAAALKEYNMKRYQGIDHDKAVEEVRTILLDNGFKFDEDNFEITENGLRIKLDITETMTKDYFDYIKEKKAMSVVIADKLNGSGEDDIWYNQTNLDYESLNRNIKFNKKLYTVPALIDKFSDMSNSGLDLLRDITAMVGISKNASIAIGAVESFLKSKVDGWEQITSKDQKAIVHGVIHHAINSKSINHQINLIFQKPGVDAKDSFNRSVITNVNFINGSNRMQTVEIGTNNLNKQQYSRLLGMLDEKGIIPIGVYGSNKNVKYVYVRELADTQNNPEKRARIIADIINERIKTEIAIEEDKPKSLQFYKNFDDFFVEKDGTRTVDISRMIQQAGESKSLAKGLGNVLLKFIEIEEKAYNAQYAMDNFMHNKKAINQKIEAVIEDYNTIYSKVDEMLKSLDPATDTETQKMRDELTNISRHLKNLTETDNVEDYIKTRNEIIAELKRVANESESIHQTANTVNRLLQQIVESNRIAIQNKISTLDESSEDLSDIRKLGDTLIEIQKDNNFNTIIPDFENKYAEQFENLIKKRVEVEHYIENKSDVDITKTMFQFLTLNRNALALDDEGLSKRLGGLMIAGSTVDSKNRLLPQMNQLIKSIYDGKGKLKIFITDNEMIEGSTKGDGFMGMPSKLIDFFHSHVFGHGGQKLSIGSMNMLIKGYASKMRGMMEPSGYQHLQSIRTYDAYDVKSNGVKQDYRFDENTILLDKSNFKILPAGFFKELGMSNAEILNMNARLATSDESGDMRDGIVIELDKKAAEAFVKKINIHAEYPNRADTRKLGTQQSISDPKFNQLFNSITTNNIDRFSGLLGGMQFSGNMRQTQYRIHKRIQNAMMQKSAMYSAIIPILSNKENANMGRIRMVDETAYHNKLSQEMNKRLPGEWEKALRITDQEGNVHRAQNLNKTWIDYNLLFDLFKDYTYSIREFDTRTKKNMKTLLDQANKFFDNPELAGNKQTEYRNIVEGMLDYLSDNKNGVLVKENLGNRQSAYHVMLTRNPAIKQGQLSHVLIEGIATPGDHNGIELPHYYTTKISGGDWDGDGILQYSISRNQLMDHYSNRLNRDISNESLIYHMYQDQMDAINKDKMTGRKEIKRTIPVDKLADYSEDILEAQTRVGTIINSIKVASALTSRLYAGPLDVGTITRNGKSIDVNKLIADNIFKALKTQNIHVERYSDYNFEHIINNINLRDNGNDFVLYDMQNADNPNTAKFRGSINYNTIQEHSMENGNKYTFLLGRLATDSDNKTPQKVVYIFKDTPDTTHTKAIAAVKYNSKEVSDGNEDIVTKIGEAFTSSREVSDLDKFAAAVNIADTWGSFNNPIELNGYGTSLNRFTQSIWQASVDEAKHHGLSVIKNSFTAGKKSYSDNIADFITKLTIASQFNINQISQSKAGTVFKSTLLNKKTSDNNRIEDTELQAVKDIVDIITKNVSKLLIDGEYTDGYPSMKEVQTMLSRHKGNFPEDDSFGKYIQLLEKYSPIIKGENAQKMKEFMDADLYQALFSYEANRDQLNRFKRNLPSQKYLSEKAAKEIGIVEPFTTKDGIFVDDTIAKTVRLYHAINNLDASSTESQLRNINSYLNFINKTGIIFQIKPGTGTDEYDFYSPDTLAQAIYKMQDRNNHFDIFLKKNEVEELVNELRVTFGNTETSFDENDLIRVFNEANKAGGDFEAELEKMKKIAAEEAPKNVIRVMQDKNGKNMTINKLISRIENMKKSGITSTKLEKINKFAGMLIGLLPKQYQSYAVLRAYGLTGDFVNKLKDNGEITTDDSGEFQIKNEKQFDNLMDYFKNRNKKLDIINEEYINNDALRVWSDTVQKMNSNWGC